MYLIILKIYVKIGKYQTGNLRCIATQNTYYLFIMFQSFFLYTLQL